MKIQNKLIVYPSGKLVWKDKEFKCALGRYGVLVDKKEGDGGTPVGCFPLRRVYYRSDRLEKPETMLPITALTSNDGWCDDLKDANYNKFVKLPYSASYENLWREDNLYDVIIILGYNDNPPVPGKGSAIFMHVARPSYSPTAGCIALSLPDLLKLLKELNTDSVVCILDAK
jgi:L,D-peptidoglycan transpeptidase YkuD (ErfK/YbiS/YcfS/YnhG family)